MAGAAAKTGSLMPGGNAAEAAAELSSSLAYYDRYQIYKSVEENQYEKEKGEGVFTTVKARGNKGVDGVDGVEHAEAADAVTPWHKKQNFQTLS